jgi:hypothetical protein
LVGIKNRHLTVKKKELFRGIPKYTLGFPNMEIEEALA